MENLESLRAVDLRCSLGALQGMHYNKETTYCRYHNLSCQPCIAARDTDRMEGVHLGQAQTPEYVLPRK